MQELWELKKETKKKSGKKVFCKNCKYLRRALSPMGWQGVCTAVIDEEVYWYGIKKKYSIIPGKQNADNNCSMFKKKPFWRFWVKKLRG